MKPKTISKKERKELRDVVCKGLGAIGYDGKKRLRNSGLQGVKVPAKIQRKTRRHTVSCEATQTASLWRMR